MKVEREKSIQNYIEGYNEFDVEKMISDLDDNVIFQNIENGVVTMTLKGITAFKLQAEGVKAYFANRQQKIRTITHQMDKTVIEIAYSATVAMDFPNGLKKGQKIELNGTTIFVFCGRKIIAITDKS